MIVMLVTLAVKLYLVQLQASKIQIIQEFLSSNLIYSIKYSVCGR